MKNSQFRLHRLIIISITILMLNTVQASQLHPLADNHKNHPHQRVLALEGGSNFRDLGGYHTLDGKTVKRSMLFRSGVMTQLTPHDEQYLNQLGISRVVDLRSQEELALYPNHWVKHTPSIEYFYYPYSMQTMMSSDKSGQQPFNMVELYRHFPTQLKPQLTIYFNQLLENRGPLVVNCAAGQDRTGMASALILSALGVPREQVIEDYLLSTRYRRPDIELGNIDINAAAQENLYAKMMLRFSHNGKLPKPKPLMTDDKIPYLVFALEEIDQRFGSVENYLNEVLAINQQDIEKLKSMYLE